MCRLPTRGEDPDPVLTQPGADARLVDDGPTHVPFYDDRLIMHPLKRYINHLEGVQIAKKEPCQILGRLRHQSSEGQKKCVCARGDWFDREERRCGRMLSMVERFRHYRF